MPVVFFAATETGANNFSGEQINFTESVDVNAAADNTIAVITLYAYNSLGTAHDILLTLAPSAASPVNEQVELESRTGINAVTVACGIPVPRGPSNSFVVLFTTSGAKDGNGTLRITYEIQTR